MCTAQTSGPPLNHFAVQICTFWAALVINANEATDTLLPRGLRFHFYKILAFTTALTSKNLKDFTFKKASQIKLLF